MFEFCLTFCLLLFKNKKVCPKKLKGKKPRPEAVWPLAWWAGLSIGNNYNHSPPTGTGTGTGPVTGRRERNRTRTYFNKTRYLQVEKELVDQLPATRENSSSSRCITDPSFLYLIYQVLKISSGAFYSFTIK